MTTIAIVTSVIIPLITGCAAAFFTANFALRRFYTEKWWEKRVEAFLKLADALYKMHKNNEYHYDKAIEARGAYPDLFSHLNEEEEGKLQEKYQEGYQELKIFSYTASLLLNEKCATEISAYLNKNESLVAEFINDEITSFEAYEQDYLLTKSLMESILLEARIELKADRKLVNVTWLKAKLDYGWLKIKWFFTK